MVFVGLGFKCRYGPDSVALVSYCFLCFGPLASNIPKEKEEVFFHAGLENKKTCKRFVTQIVKSSYLCNRSLIFESTLTRYHLYKKSIKKNMRSLLT